MSLEVLDHVEQRAARAMDWTAADYERVREYQQPQRYSLGPIEIREGLAPEAIATHCGGADLYKGGTSMRAGDTAVSAQTGGELSREMLSKTAQAGLVDPAGEPIGGNKIVVGVDPSNTTHTERIAMFEGLAGAMSRYTDKYGRPLADITSTAGDMGTNHPDYMNAYVQRVHENDPSFRYWRAAATGTSEALGGLAYRERATGDGTADAARWGVQEYQRQTGQTIPVADVTALGVGAVGGWALHNLSQDPAYRVAGFRDFGGTVQITDTRPGAPGIEFTLDMVREVGANARFRDDYPRYGGNKAQALAERIARNQPGLGIKIDETNILAVPTHVFIPAAGKDCITEGDVATMTADVLACGANGPYTLKAYQAMAGKSGLLVARKRIIVPDTVANVRGVACSMKEVHAKAAIADGRTPQTSDEAAAELRAEGWHQYDQVRKMADLLEVDEPVAAAAIGMARMGMRVGVTIDPAIRAIVEAPVPASETVAAAA